MRVLMCRCGGAVLRGMIGGGGGRGSWLNVSSWYRDSVGCIWVRRGSKASAECLGDGGSWSNKNGGGSLISFIFTASPET